MPVELQPPRPVRLRRWQIDFGAIPPRVAIRTVGRHRERGEHRADRVGDSLQRPQVQSDERVRQAVIGNEGTDHRRRNCGRRPAASVRADARQQASVRRDLDRGADHPALAEPDRYRLRLKLCCGGEDRDERETPPHEMSNNLWVYGLQLTDSIDPSQQPVGERWTGKASATF